ncbi:MAG: hypothetical protein JWQ38_3753 [Flavipsychrobacter sp.]|nr:hypothetical protein [Flavipsychrobacter sp.]
MKKRSILSILVICVTANLFAQPDPKTLKNHFPTMQTHHNAGKTTALNASRCIAMVQSSYNGSSYDAFDSTTYSYSAGRVGSPLGQMKYDNGSGYSLMTGVKQMMLTQTFDSHNNILVCTEQDLDLISGVFVNSRRTTYTYDAMNNPLTETTEIWNATAWEKYNKYVRTFTAANEVATEALLWWFGGSWGNSTYYNYIYNSLHDPILSIEKKWDLSTSIFMLSSKDTMVYDLSNNLSYELSYNYHTSANTWDTGYKISYSSYLAPDMPRIIIQQNWDATSSTFKNSHKDSFSCNSSNLPVYMSEMNANASNIWEYGTQAHFYYELYASGVTEISNTSASPEIYPNPCSSQLNIAAPYLISSVSVSNLLGRTIHNYEFNSDKVQMNVNDLPSGAYIIRINGSDVRKLVKR